MNTLQSEWDLFAKLAIPPNAPGIQINQLRTAFYAGAATILRPRSSNGSMPASGRVRLSILR